MKEISSEGETVEGEFKKKFDDVKRFETQVPTFANTDQLSASAARSST